LAMAEMLSLERITTEGTQARIALSDTVIREYATVIEQGDEFPPIEVYSDETTYWLADGFHRVQATQRAGRDTIAAIVHQGGQREALLHALGANETHGHRRTDADRRHAVELMFADPEWRGWNNSAIARQCGVSEFLVRTVRQELEPAIQTQETPERTRKVTRGDKTFTVRTGRIGSATPRKRSSPSTSQPQLSTDHSPIKVPIELEEWETPAALSSIQSKIDTPPDPPLYVHQEETPAGPAVPTQTAHEISAEPVIAQPQPSLTDAWQQASDDERQAFVAMYRDDLRLLLAAHDEQPKKRASASKHTSQPQQKQKRQRAAASKRS
jgi:hypothetical protein